MKHDSAFLEREYNARAAIPGHPQIFARWAEQGAITRRLRACLIDLPFGDTAAERLDYFPTRVESAPLLVFIHGGYWRSLDKSDFSWLAPPFVQHGVALALLNYGLAPATPIEDIVRQQIRALAWLYRNAVPLFVFMGAVLDKSGAADKLFNAFYLAMGGLRGGLALATFVICTIGVGSRRAWEQDVFVPRKFGIIQPAGDSVMPGGISRAMRMIPPMVDIATDSQRMCPEARFINYSNPMPMVVRALYRKTNVRALGLCMGTEETVRYLAEFSGIPQNSVSARWVGLNHLTWITELRTDGKDAWPLVRARLAERSAATASTRQAGHRRCSGPAKWQSPAARRV